MDAQTKTPSQVVTELTKLVDENHRSFVPSLVQTYLRHVDEADLADRDAAQVAQMLAHHLEIAANRKPGEVVVRILPPDSGDWQPHNRTVIQVVTDDSRFIVDTISMTLTGLGWSILQVLHPQYHVTRDESGALQSVAANSGGVSTVSEPKASEAAESWVQVEATSPLGDSAEHLAPSLQQALVSALSDVQVAVRDYPAMTEKMLAARELLLGNQSGTEAERTAASGFLSWLEADNFTYLGYREYLVDGQDFTSVPGTGLGVLAEGSHSEDRFHAVPYGESRALVVMTKDSRLSTVHRRAFLDYIGVRIHDEAGRVVGERRFLGLLATTAYTESVEQIPVLAAKQKRILELSGYPQDSHGGDTLAAVLATFPRDWLFHAPVEELFPIVNRVATLQERRRVRLFARTGHWGRFLYCLVYFPRDRYNTKVRLRMEDVLRQAAGAEYIDYRAQVSQSALARLYFVLKVAEPNTLPQIDTADLERQLTEATHHWDDDFESAVAELPSEQRGIEFPQTFQDDYTAKQAVSDLRMLNRVTGSDDMRFAVFTPDRPGDISDIRLKIFRVGAEMSLSDIMPHFTSLGVRVVDEVPYTTVTLRGQSAGIYDFGLQLPSRGEQQWSEADTERFTEAFEASYSGWMNTDELNRLVTAAELDWRQVFVLRAISRYLLQLGTTFSQAYIAQTLTGNPDIAVGLVRLFELKFDPHRNDADDSRRAAVREQRQQVLQLLDDVSFLDHDRIVRQFVDVIDATLRTNRYLPDSRAVALKIATADLSMAPQPRPAFEIFVHSPQVDGVHLRFGAIARGGLRWSDRPEDFRTEILGLVKAQMVKNTVIVPTGAKGGFYVPGLPTEKAVRAEAGLAAYRQFIGALLDVTDNIVDGEVVHPERVVCHDGDDPYLVVAADKGTASFSDDANEVALQRDFWLGDAFASGGSDGYDHKEMGITARGAWESVRRHFFEMGIDWQNEDITVVGIGDMTGDVFGNGMLLSEHIRLIGAFNHLHVFLDPDPDAATSFTERQRLFETKGSSWADYDSGLISAGGGVYSRRDKAIPISDEVRSRLLIDDDVTELTPAQMISTLLAAPVHLLWNGGIGTYVKASTEQHPDVGDRANDAVRINGSQVLARCAGEGGNLGWTQAGRIEYARRGGRINTDFIDNSAGVDTSDHEVNIKILLNRAVAAGELSTEERRQLLPTMTEDVASLVLRHNIDQNLTLANAAATAVKLAGVHEDWMCRLEAEGYLDRDLEQLPSSAQLAERIADGEGLTGPELCSLLAWTKIFLTDKVTASSLPDAAFLADRLVRYFPSALRERFGHLMTDHRLKREIIATVAVNRFVDSQGLTAFHQLSEDTGADVEDVIRAQLAARSVFDAGGFEVGTRLRTFDAENQTALRLVLSELVERGTRWMLRFPAPLDIQDAIDRYRAGVRQVMQDLPEVLTEAGVRAYQRRLDHYLDAGVDDDLAHVAAAAPAAHQALPIVRLAHQHDLDVLRVARLWFALAEEIGLDDLQRRIEELPMVSRWDAMARSGVREDASQVQSDLTSVVLSGADTDQPTAAVVLGWCEQYPRTESVRALIDAGVRSGGDLPQVAVGLRAMRSLVEDAATD